ncbi:hypothetical protein VI817_003607 [Penicillium citrinum]|nr:hypothetical protein VI817_003607 [Penicillium citrinum]
MAYAAPYTSTAGYISNAEINDMIKNHGSYFIVKSSIDKASDSMLSCFVKCYYIGSSSSSRTSA